MVVAAVLVYEQPALGQRCICVGLRPRGFTARCTALMVHCGGGGVGRGCVYATGTHQCWHGPHQPLRNALVRHVVPAGHAAHGGGVAHAGVGTSQRDGCNARGCTYSRNQRAELSLTVLHSCATVQLLMSMCAVSLAVVPAWGWPANRYDWLSCNATLHSVPNVKLSPLYTCTVFLPTRFRNSPPLKTCRSPPL